MIHARGFAPIAVVAVIAAVAVAAFLIASITSGSPEPVVTGEFPQSAEADPVSGTIAFVRKVGDENHIFVMNADGTDVQDIVSCGPGECYPSWSPDGDQFVFERSENDGPGIYTVNVDGSGLTRLSPRPGRDVRPSWSPDGKQIIFTRVVKQREDGIPDTDILVMNADGTGARTILPSNGTFNVEARYSPDGSKITLMRGENGVQQQIYVMNPDGTGLTQITSEGFSGDPVWSPDGSRISFGSTREGTGKLNVFVVNADGTNPVQLTYFAPPYEAGDTTWSPDGTHIAFELDIGGKGQSDPDVPAEIWIVRVDGSGVAWSTGQACAAVGCAPRWAPEPR